MPLRKNINRLCKIRIQKDISGYDLQILSSIPSQEIYRIERGLKRPLPHEKAWIAKALNMPEAEIFPEDLKSNQEVVSY